MTGNELERLETRLHQLEHEVLKEQRFMHDFIERANLMVVGLDRDGRVMIFNRKAEAVTGYTKEDVLGAMLDEVFVPDAGNSVHTLVESFRLCAGSGFRRETRLVTKDGEPRNVVWHASCLTDGSDLVGLMAFGEDRTAVGREEERARWFAAIGLLQQFASKLAHGLNNLLGTVLGHASLLRAQTAAGSSQYENAEEIEAGVRRCAAVLGRVLQFGNGASSKPERVELGAGVQGVLERLQSETPSSVALGYTPPDEAIHVKADAGQIGQVLGEVVHNAVEAMPDGGHIDVAVGTTCVDSEFCAERPGLQPGWYGTVQVTDTGPGILPEESLRLLEPFHSTKQTRCAGLGLSIAYGVLRANGGWIDLTGDPGTGTTATIYLPLDVSDAEPVAVDESARKGPQTILLVDDEQVLVDTVSDMLKHLGYLVLTAGDGDEAVRIYEEHKANVDLIILDMIMPHKGGPEAYEDLKRIQPDVKVLLTSGFEQQKVVAEGMCEEGAAGFVEKPYRLSDLSKLIRRAIEKRSQPAPEGE
jgi:two-component system cell cycle sensor histidine kinase/response regulator CckA